MVIFCFYFKIKRKIDALKVFAKKRKLKLITSHSRAFMAILAGIKFSVRVQTDFYFYVRVVREAAKKSLLVGRPLRGGGGGKAWPLWKKTFVETLFRKKNLWPLRSRGGWEVKP